MQKMDDEEFIRKLKEKGILHKLVPITWYKGNNRTKVKILCLDCYDVYEVMPLHILAGKGCPNCAGKKRWNKCAVEYYLKEHYGDRYENMVSDDFSGKNCSIVVYDTETGELITLTISEMLDEKETLEIPDEITKKVEALGSEYSCLWYDSDDDCVTIKYNDEIYHCTKEEITKCKEDNNMVLDNKTEIFARKLEKARPGEFTVVGKYTNLSELLDIKCNKCGGIFQARPKKLLYSHKKCPHCSVKIPEKLNQESFVNKVKDLTGDEYSILGTYKNGKTPILIKHNTCGCEFEMRPEDFLRGQRCPECARKKGAAARLAYSTETFKEKVMELVGTEYSVLSEYTGIDKYITLKHNVCGHEYKVYPMNFIKGNRCPYCSHGHIMKTQEEFEKEVAAVDPDYEVVGEYTGWKNKILMKHLPCGTTFKIYPNNFLYKGGRCKVCALKEKSRPEEEIVDYIKSIYSGKVEENHREYSGKTFTEVDIYMEELKLGIEFDGLYWHSEEQGKDKNFHIGKTNKLAESGFKLTHIFEDEWLNHKDAVKSLLASYIVKYNEPLEICKPEENEIQEFTKKYSLSENNTYDYCLALKSKDEIVGVFLFIFGTSKKALILKNVICRKNIGGNMLGSLLDKALTETKTDYVISGADCRLYPPIDNIFIENGFVAIRTKQPTMWYTKNGNARAKTPFEVKRQFRVWDCGKTIYKYSKNIKKKTT